MIYKKTTKEIFGESILELANAKTVDKITVKEIAENCGYSSATFYNNFIDKDDLVSWVYLYQTEEIWNDFVEGNNTWYQALFETATLLNSNRSFYKNAFKNSKGQNSFLNTVHGNAVDLIKSLMKTKCKNYDREIDFYVDIYIRGTTYSFEDWIINDKDYTPEELALYMCNVVPEKLKDFFV